MSKPPSESSTVVIRRMHPQTATPAGTVFGGVILAQCDEAAGIASSRHTRMRVCRDAAMPAASSHWARMIPPNTVPAGLAVCGCMRRMTTVEECEGAGTVSGATRRWARTAR